MTTAMITTGDCLELLAAVLPVIVPADELSATG
jgi:hypothetical protein